MPKEILTKGNGLTTRRMALESTRGQTVSISENGKTIRSMERAHKHSSMTPVTRETINRDLRRG